MQDSGSTVDLQGHALTANSLLVGWGGSSSVTVSNLGLVTLNTLEMGNSTAGSNLTLHGGDAIKSEISLMNGSVLTVDQVGGIGLTLDGSLTLERSSMDLVFNATGWDFRWQDPSGGGNWISTINGLIGTGAIVLDLPSGFSYQVVDQGGYTYINAISGAAVPEPLSIVMGLIGLSMAGGLALVRRRSTR